MKRRAEKIKLVIDNDVLERYSKHYFELHPRAKKPPIQHPYHESINTWMIMKRMAMNALKQKWKDFICWFVSDNGYADMSINRCELSHKIFFPTNRRHDVDNYVPKFINDGLVVSGMIVDDDSLHITKLTLECDVDSTHPRTEITIKILNDESKGDLLHGKQEG